MPPRSALHFLKKTASVFHVSAAEAPPQVAMRHRIACGLLVGTLVGCVGWWGNMASGGGARDFNDPMREAQEVLHHRDPYALTVGFDHVPYPLTAALLAVPFLPFPAPLAGGLFSGISAGLLAFAITRYGRNRLLLFLSYPFFSALVTVQWSPLLMAGACLPWLLPVIIAKPNLALPIVLRSATLVGLGVSAALSLFTLILVPAWPLTWLHRIGGYQSFFPLASGVGCLLLLALTRYKSKDARFLLLMALIPQRWFYDALLLWFIPSTTVEFVAASALSWGALFLIPQTRTIHQVALLSVIFNYLPMLAIVLIRPWLRVVRKGAVELQTADSL